MAMPSGKFVALLAKSLDVDARKSDCFRGKRKKFSLIDATIARAARSAHGSPGRPDPVGGTCPICENAFRKTPTRTCARAGATVICGAAWRAPRLCTLERSRVLAGVAHRLKSLMAETE